MAMDKDTVAVVEALIAKIGELQKSGGGLTTEQLDKLLEKTAGTTAEAFRHALIPENKTHPGISVYSYPEGERARPNPKLVMDVIFCGYRQRVDNLTPEEIQACNALADGQAYEARDGQWSARKVRDGTKSLLLVHCVEAIDRDRARDLPPMLNILLELKNGPQAVDLAFLSRQLDEMRGRLVQAGLMAPDAPVGAPAA
jgi:hypothetical protein